MLLLLLLSHLILFSLLSSPPPPHPRSSVPLRNKLFCSEVWSAQIHARIYPTSSDRSAHNFFFFSLRVGRTRVVRYNVLYIFWMLQITIVQSFFFVDHNKQADTRYSCYSCHADSSDIDDLTAVITGRAHFAGLLRFIRLHDCNSFPP